LSILCSTNCSTNSPPGVCRRHDRFEPSPFSRSRRRKGRGEARGAGAGHSRRGCVPASPVVGVRRQPPAGCLLAPRQVERTTNRTPARLWCSYRAHLRYLGDPNTTGAPAFLNEAKAAAWSRSHPFASEGRVGTKITGFPRFGSRPTRRFQVALSNFCSWRGLPLQQGKRAATTGVPSCISLRRWARGSGCTRIRAPRWSTRAAPA
jgi:hypothetical protein